MKNSIIILSLFLLFGACNKPQDEVNTCTEIELPYESVKSFGDTAVRVKVAILKKDVDNYNGEDCAGIFMWIVGSDSEADPDSRVNFYKVTNELPLSVLNNTNFGNTEWFVDVKYLGVGINCYVLAHLIDPKPGETVQANDVELVEITDIERVL